MRAKENISPASKLAGIVLCLFCMANVGCAGFSAQKPAPPITAFSISGKLNPATGGSGATVTLSGATRATTTVDSSGNYTFSGLPSGSYTVTPAKKGSTFSPTTQGIIVRDSDVTEANFSVSQQSAIVSISGFISPAANGIATTVTLSGETNATGITESSGKYIFSGLSIGSYTLTPNKTGFTFSPSNRTVTASGSDVTGANFIANQPPVIVSISGFISPAAKGIATAVTLSGATSASATADSSGKYTFTGVPAGSYTLTPQKTGLTFSPSSRTVTASGPDITGVNFSVNQATVVMSISGFISPAAKGTATTVTLSGTTNANATTDSSGKYTFSGLPAGSYTLTPNKTGFTFSPSSRTVTASSANLTGVNFTAGPTGQRSGPIVINGQNGTVIEGLRITSSSGTCVTITNSTNITIQSSEIGPCAGNGIAISGGSGINIFDSYIHPETLAAGCCDHNDGILASGGTHDLLIQGNVIAYGESNIEIQGGQTVSVIGNFLLNPRDEQSGPGPRGNNFQCWNHCSNVVVQNNYALSSLDTTRYLYPEAAEDSINFGVTTGFVVQNNFITGGHSQYGCGIMADTFSNNGQILNNRLLDTGQCGIGLTDGTHVANGNKIQNANPVTGGGNTAMYVAHYGKSNICGPMTIAENIADELRVDGTHSGWWNAKNCGTIDISTDTFNGTAKGLLTPISNVFVPPLIPPQPRNCVVTSPYSTQTTSLPCVP
jgi:hypothetical protein